MSLNPALSSVAPSATVALMDRARNLVDAGKDIISLAGGEPDAPPAGLVREAGIERIRSGRLAYGPVAGLRELRCAIAARLSLRHDCVYTPEQIVVGTGSKQVLSQALFAGCAPGDKVLIPSPYWVSYPAMAQLAGAEPQIVPTSADQGYKLTPDRLSEALTPPARWLILNSPNNPTGAVYTAQELVALADVIARHPRLLILCDDIYEDIVFGDFEHVPLARAAPQLRDRIVTCSGFSKGHAMTGMRVGYASGPAWLISAIVKLQSHLTSGGCVVGQAAAVAALNAAESFPCERLSVYASRRALMLDQLARAPSLRVRAPEGAFYCWIDIRELLGRRTATGHPLTGDEDFSEALLAEAGLAAVPGSAFGAPGHLRLSFANDDALLLEGCRRLVNFANLCRAP